MYRRQIGLLAILLVIGVSIVLAMHWIAETRQSRTNGFNRKIRNDIIEFRAKMDIKYNSYYISGLSDDGIYLANTTDYGHLLKADWDLKDTSHLKILFPANVRTVRTGMKAFTFDSALLMSEGNTPTFFGGSLDSLQLRHIDGDLPKYNLFVPSSDTTGFIRCYDSDQSQSYISRISLDLLGNRIRKFERRFLLTKEVDELFYKDGFFVFNEYFERLFYISYYTNSFLSLNSKLDLLFEKNTIDTVSIPRIAVTTFKDGSKKLATPMLFVNKLASSSNASLFVQSGVMADNELQESFDNYFPVDVYSVADGTYKYSFYLPYYRGKKLSAFRVFKDMLVAIYYDVLIVFLVKD